jgi:hypothetical protein
MVLFLGCQIFCPQPDHQREAQEQEGNPTLLGLAINGLYLLISFSHET